MEERPATGDRTCAISIRQPAALLVLHGGKDVENRTGAMLSANAPPTSRLAVGGRSGVHGRTLVISDVSERLVTSFSE